MEFFCLIGEKVQVGFVFIRGVSGFLKLGGGGSGPHQLRPCSSSNKQPVRLFGTPEYVVYDKIWVLPPLEQGNSLLQNDPFFGHDLCKCEYLHLWSPMKNSKIKTLFRSNRLLHARNPNASYIDFITPIALNLALTEMQSRNIL